MCLLSGLCSSGVAQFQKGCSFFEIAIAVE
jgi:hypothetical protein